MTWLESLLRRTIDFALKNPLLAGLAVLVVLVLPPFAWLVYKLVDFVGDLLNWGTETRAKLKKLGDQLIDFREKSFWLWLGVLALLFSAFPLIVPLAVTYALLDKKKGESWSQLRADIASPPAGPAAPSATAPESGSTYDPNGTGWEEWARQWFTYGF